MGYFKNTENKLKQLLSQNPVYTRSQFPGMMLGTAQNTALSQMPGLQEYLRSKDAAYGTQLSNINKNATDASQALALGAAAAAERDNVSDNVLGMEADWKKFGLSNLNDAYGAMAQEDRYVNENNQMNYQNKVQLEGAIAANKYAKRRALWDTVSGIANIGTSILTGGMKFPKKEGSSASGSNSTASGYQPVWR